MFPARVGWVSAGTHPTGAPGDNAMQQPPINAGTRPEALGG